MQEADEIYVLDTGSTDKTVSLLKKRNVHVKSKNERMKENKKEFLKLFLYHFYFSIYPDVGKLYISSVIGLYLSPL